jgi:hypothetical protein
MSAHLSVCCNKERENAAHARPEQVTTCQKKQARIRFPNSADRAASAGAATSRCASCQPTCQFAAATEEKNAVHDGRKAGHNVSKEASINQEEASNIKNKQNSTFKIPHRWAVLPLLVLHHHAVHHVCPLVGLLQQRKRKMQYTPEHFTMCQKKQASIKIP